VAEVDPGALGDVGDAGGGHPLGSEQVGGNVQQLVADGGVVGAGRAGPDGGAGAGRKLACGSILIKLFN